MSLLDEMNTRGSPLIVMPPILPRHNTSTSDTATRSLDAYLDVYNTVVSCWCRRRDSNPYTLADSGF